MARPDSVADRTVARKPVPWGLTMAVFGLLLPLVALTACGGGGDVAETGGAPAPASGPKGAAVAAPGAEPKPAPVPGLAALGPASGFTPLPSPQQVIEPLAQGRQDPFAPLPLPQVGPATPSLPAGFLFTGVIQSRGLTQAIVQLGGSGTGVPAAGSGSAASQAVAEVGPSSATLCIGPRGKCPGAGKDDYLLPPGWSVTGIDLRQGLLSLRQGGLPLRLPLGAGSGAGPGQAAGTPNSASAANSPAGSPAAGGQAGSPATTASAPAASLAPNAALGAGTGR